MTSARQIMIGSVECAKAEETVTDAARKMAELGVGALPICGSGDRLRGMLTDRDIVASAGKDPATTKAGDLAQGEAVTIGADDDAGEVMTTMTSHQVRRPPVIDGHRLVGVIALADVAH